MLTPEIGQPVTLRQIAEKAGVAVSTVSHILGKRGKLYDPKTRAAVLCVAQKLGYRKNAAARAVATGRFGCFSLLLSANPGFSHLPDPLVRGIQDGLARQRMYLIVSTVADEQLANETSMPSLLNEVMADGLLINYRLNIPAGMAASIRKHHIPSVWINSKAKQDCVYPAEFEAAKAGTEYLLRKGHRRVAYVDCHYPWAARSRTPHFSEVEREAGYAAAMREAGLAAESIRPDDWLRDQDYAGFLERLLARQKAPTALVTYSDVTGLPALYAANRMSLRTAEQFSVVTFSDRPMSALAGQMQVLVVPNRALGDAAVEMLVEKVNAPAKKAPAHEVSFDLAALRT
ncbi:MAG: LacI family DNA-binding transcriptional regulator [Planctomycetes bacterium]|nr:LacI family DNA-binding transcriptional regulator [Planctomycetota bacterium]